MSNIIYTVDFENTRLYDPNSKGFDIIAAWGGTMEVNTDSAYQGSYGCKITPIQNYSIAGAKRITDTKRFRQAFYLHPNGISITAGATIRIARNHYYDANNWRYSIQLKNTGGTYYIVGGAQDTKWESYYSGDLTLDYQTGWNKLETDWYAASGTGFFKVWINGNLRWNLTTLINDTLWVNQPGIGCYNCASPASGSFYIDYWRANITGSGL